MQKLGSNERGQSLAIITFVMLVLLAVGALSIDVASWYQKHHQAQVAADAAALAAANCLANGGSGNTCTSTSDTTDAATVATSIAAANGVTIPMSDVTFTTNNVSVTTPDSAPAFFAGVVGIHSAHVQASAAATWTPPTTPACTTAGAQCDFMFADDSNCSSRSNGIHMSSAGNADIYGNIQSNGNVDISTAGNPSFGTATYGPSNSTGTCAYYTSAAGSNPWTTPPTQASSDSPYPLDYTQDFPACGGAGELACAASGYPTFCTKTGTSFTGLDPASGNIYCASGSGSTSTPSTWTGSITISASGSNTWYDSFVGGNISYSVAGSDTLSSCGYEISGYAQANCSAGVPTPATPNYPIFYATGSSSTALNISISGGQTLNGDMFAPNGTADLSLAGSQTLVTFIEAKDISASIAGTFDGDGPESGGNGHPTPGSDALTQ